MKLSLLARHSICAFAALPALAAAAAQPAAAYEELAPLPTHAQTSIAVVDRLRHHHFKSKTLNDAASGEIFDNYLAFLDPRRIHFLASDVEEFGKYRAALDDALEDGDLEPAFAIYNRYHRRALERIEHDIALLQGGIGEFDFDRDESVALDREDAPWPASAADARALWRLSLKSSALAAKLGGEAPETIAETLAKRVKNRLRGLRQTRSEDVFQSYLNAFARIYDDHTQYFSPRTSENFNIAMSLSLEGIGAVLGSEGDHTVVQSLVKGGPAELGSDLKPKERIVAVSQSEDEPFVDIVGWRTDEVVQLIRGPKGSPVRLKVVPEGGDPGDARVVTIERNVVKLDDQGAKKSTLSVQHAGRDYTIGIIDIPTFYMDFEALRRGDPDFRSTTRDVAALIGELQEEGIDALLIDLRNNGGGSLQEARALAGLFLASGPVVQVSDLNRTTVLADGDDAVAWQGPLAVVVNRLSASASEIFAGAMQDHGLGVIVGSRTFGKGTVQTLIPLRRGELKVTERMYYRVSGAGTDRVGVTPDIAFPSPTLPWGRRDDDGEIDPELAQIPAADYSAANHIAPLLDTLQIRHAQRVAHDPDFAYLQSRKEYAENLEQRTHLSLREATRIAEKEADDASVLAIENALLAARGEEPAADLDEVGRRREERAAGASEAAQDAILRETANILADMAELNAPLAIAERRAAANAASASAMPELGVAPQQ